MSRNNIKARKMIIDILLEEIKMHENESFTNIGTNYEVIEDKLSQMNVNDHDIGLAMVFWDAWIDEKNHNFAENYKGIKKYDWPNLALNLVDYLEKKVDFIEPIITKHFKLI